MGGKYIIYVNIKEIKIMIKVDHIHLFYEEKYINF